MAKQLGMCKWSGVLIVIVIVLLTVIILRSSLGW